ncbi:hypothetical protein [Hymenobacter sp. GOD-10R]|uniref:hypothetical protein n=1 Tax=Hymenobacter sp. GOD-10R TaxID=3093922 RepID=UPI002D7699A0|nr:hypothetical protein [Hymenobacter sp. GOD-10R]WRQ26762.1 hypothetical protein SD425_16945 [Hymenobacter sp. GOD-10R]
MPKQLGLLLVLALGAFSSSLAQTTTTKPKKAEQDAANTAKAAESRTADALRAYTPTNTGSDSGGEERNYYTFNHRYNGMSGTPFLVAGWRKGEVHLDHNQVVRNVSLKYDLYRHGLLALQPNGDSIIVGLDRVQEFVIHDTHVTNAGSFVEDHRFRRYADAPEAKFSREHFEVLSEGSYATLLKLTRKELQRANQESAYGSTQVQDVMLDKAEYFVRNADGHIRAFKLNRKALVAALPEHAAEVQEAMTKYGQPVQKEADVIRVVAILNSTAPAGSK